MTTDALADPEVVDETIHHAQLPKRLWVLLSLALVLVGLTAGIQGADYLQNRQRDRSDTASGNRQTCLSVQNANWRKAVSTFLVAYSGKPDEVDAMARKLHLTGRTVPALKEYARQQLVKALLDDGRIGDKVNPLCPFVAGNPSLTPDKPVTTTTTPTPTT